MEERLICIQEVEGTLREVFAYDPPLIPPNMLAESEVDEELVCETSVNGFKSRRPTQLEGAAAWSATGRPDVDNFDSA